LARAPSGDPKSKPASTTPNPSEAETETSSKTAAASTSKRSESAYTVVARRYRPRRFEDVVGQDHVVRALRNAIRLDRVAQAYLFSGTRGVGKTSMARIFAKALNCVEGPTETPCDRCEICQEIASGQDVDVIEIDGASNNGVEAVRELRQNAGYRPSRARFKIYYIDEVHMLSVAAFNALLKTLEEPPAHVKFIFATTEPRKIPITVLSRCQRFDFSGIDPSRIVDQLAAICEAEGLAADREALQVVARRAAGSMRDAQSLLEQLLASGTEALTIERVRQVLGVAGDDQVLELLETLADRDAAGALKGLDRAIAEGVQPSELLNATIEFLRDAMVAAVGAEVPSLAALPGQVDRLKALADRWPIDTVLAALQILDETRGRLRGSPHERLLVELGLARVARLEDFTELGALIQELSGLEAGTGGSDSGAGSEPTSASKKKRAEGPADALKSNQAIPSAPKSPSSAESPPRDRAPAASGSNGQIEPAASHRPVEATAPNEAEAGPEATSRPEAAPSAERDAGLDAALRAWERLGERLEDPSDLNGLKRLKPERLTEANVLVVPVPASYNWIVDSWESRGSSARIEAALSELMGRRIALRFDREPAPEPSTAAKPDPRDAVRDDPLVRQILERFDVQKWRIEANPDAETDSETASDTPDATEPDDD